MVQGGLSGYLDGDARNRKSGWNHSRYPELFFPAGYTGNQRVLPTMRNHAGCGMDKREHLTARDIVNDYSEAELYRRNSSLW